MKVISFYFTMDTKSIISLLYLILKKDFLRVDYLTENIAMANEEILSRTYQNQMDQILQDHMLDTIDQFNHLNNHQQRDIRYLHTVYNAQHREIRTLNNRLEVAGRANRRLTRRIHELQEIITTDIFPPSDDEEDIRNIRRRLF